MVLCRNVSTLLHVQDSRTVLRTCDACLMPGMKPGIGVGMAGCAHGNVPCFPSCHMNHERRALPMVLRTICHARHARSRL